MSSFGKTLVVISFFLISYLLITINLSLWPVFAQVNFTTPPVYEITPGIPNAPALPGLTFFVKQFDLDYKGGKVMFSSNPDGTGNTLVDDAVTVNIVTSSGFLLRAFDYKYTSGCNPLVPLPPKDLAYLFTLGINHVKVRLYDICGVSKSSTPLYLVAESLAPSPSPSQSPSPSPSGPEPFLDLPWDYDANGMSFNEAATSINSYFDHQYPFLSTSLTEPPLIVRYFDSMPVNDDYSSHDGYDYGYRAQTKFNTPVLAAADGEATFMSSCLACGNAILIDHKNGYQTRYYHMQPEGLITNVPGQKVNVTKGQQIGKVGYTGNVKPGGEAGSHLHFMVVQDKNGDGNFEDNIPDGITDPFGWQSTAPDPWETYSFTYAGAQRTGNKSYYLFTKKLDNLNSSLTSNAAVFNVGKTKLEFPQGATNENLNFVIKTEPNFTSNLLNSLGSIVNIVAKTQSGNPVTSFLTNFILTIDFSQFDLSRYNLDTLSIYSSPDGENWTKENTTLDLNNNTATTSINHLTYFALMAERKDTLAPTTTPVLEGEKGTANNFRSDVLVNLNALDNPDGLGVEYSAYGFNDSQWQTYTTPLTFSDEGSHKIYFYSQDKDGNIEEVKSVEFSIDKTPPEININSPKDNDVYLLNQTGLVAGYSCSDLGGSGLQSCQGTIGNGENINTGFVGEKIFKVEAADNAGNQTTKDVPYKVQYNSSGLCNGEAGHTILQPINPDGASVFKQGSTVPAKFRVCDINGVPVSENPVQSFTLTQVLSNTSTAVNEPVDPTTPDSNFRFDPEKKQWIFNMSTKNLSAGKTYFYKILLNDLTDIQFSFGLR